MIEKILRHLNPWAPPWKRERQARGPPPTSARKHSPAEPIDPQHNADDYAVDPKLRNDLGILVRWRPDGEPSLELTPLRLGFCETSVASGADADWIAERLTLACRSLGTGVERVSEKSLVVRA